MAADQALTDGMLVTAPAWPAHPAWLAQLLAILDGRIERRAPRSVSQSDVSLA